MTGHAADGAASTICGVLHLLSALSSCVWICCRASCRDSSSSSMSSSSSPAAAAAAAGCGDGGAGAGRSGAVACEERLCCGCASDMLSPDISAEAWSTPAANGARGCVSQMLLHARHCSASAELQTCSQCAQVLKPEQILQA